MNYSKNLEYQLKIIINKIKYYIINYYEYLIHLLSQIKTVDNSQIQIKNTHPFQAKLLIK